MVTLERQSACKINLLLNVLGKRADGYHELETVLQPVPLCDRLAFERRGPGLKLTCNRTELPADSTNLVWRAAAAFLQQAGLTDGVRIHLEKVVPLAAGLGGGSSNAAATLLALNELFDQPLTAIQVNALAAALGADVPFFLQSKPALGTGRGDQIVPVDFFPALRGAHLLLIYPGFGISTAWVYQQLGRYPLVLRGQPGRACQLMGLLKNADLAAAGPAFYNSLERPVLAKYPVLVLFKEFLREHGAPVALMSGSGSSTFALFESRAIAESALAKFKEKFNDNSWTKLVRLPSKLE